MGLVSFVLTLPLAPMRSVISLARVLEQRANEELYDPARVRQRLEEIEEAAESGDLSAERAARLQEEILAPVVGSGSPTGAPETGPEPETEAGSQRNPGAGPPAKTGGDDFVTVRRDDADGRDAAEPA